MSRYCGTQVQFQIRKVQPQLLTKIKSDVQSFHKMLSGSQFCQCGDPSASSLFSSHSFARKLSLKVWRSILFPGADWPGLGHPRGRGWNGYQLSRSRSPAGCGWAVKSRWGGDPPEWVAGCLGWETLHCVVMGYLWKASGELRLTQGNSRVFHSAPVLSIC